MRLTSLLAVATIALSLPIAHAQSPLSERRYVVVTNGRVQGSEVVTPRAGDELAVAFEFNDRGRGPKISSVLRVGEGFVPTRVETSGVDYFKNTVAERFDA